MISEEGEGFQKRVVHIDVLATLKRRALDYQGVSRAALQGAIAQKNKFVVVFPQYEESTALEAAPAAMDEGTRREMGGI